LSRAALGNERADAPAVVPQDDTPGALVLVVGAGPTGVLAAIELARRGVRVRIIEQQEGPFAGSRAKGVQPRTLEIFEDIGVIDEVLASGGTFPRWRSYQGAELAWEKSIYQLIGIAEPRRQPSTPYPETWMIPQGRTEEILRAALRRLGVEVEYATRLVALENEAGGVTATIEQRGQPRRVRASYALAADGARSTARKLLGVAFEGETREDDRFLIADVRTGDLDRTYWHNWSSPSAPGERVSVCPLPCTDVFQYVAPIPAGEPAPALALETIQAIFDARSGRSDVRFAEAPWITLHRTNVRLASRYRVGRVFILGDAAHAPPAAGGQGMNMSLQDSYNLAWKLAAVLRGAPDPLLDTYEQERRAIAARLAGVPLSAEDPEEKPDIFQLGISYRRSAISREARAAPGAVQAGDRAPDAPVHVDGSTSRRLFDLMRGVHFTCLVFNAGLASDCAAVSERWRAIADVRVVDVSQQDAASLDLVREIYGVGNHDGVMFLIRPDGYVGLAADDRAGDRLDEYLHELLAPQA